MKLIHEAISPAGLFSRSSLTFKEAKLGFIVVLLLFSATAWCQGSALDVSASSSSSARTLGVHVIQRLGSQVPMNAVFKDQTGATVHFGDLLADKPAIVLPIFYRCQGVCTSEMQNLIATIQKMPKKVGRDFSVIVVGIDPQETPKMAEQKFTDNIAPVKAFDGTSAGWHFLTGSLDQIRSVTDALGFFYSYDPSTDLINHPAGIMFLTHDGRVSNYILNPYTYSPNEFGKDLATAITSTVGVPVPDEFFGCIHCDPVTGQKSINIMRVLSLLGAITVIALAGTIFMLMRSPSKKLGAGSDLPS